MKMFITILAALVMGAASAYADATGAGAAELNLLVAIFTGKIGLTLGLAVSIMGIFMAIRGNAGGGLFVLIMGVLITMLPGMYNGFRYIMCPIAESLGGQCGGFSSN